MTKVITTKPMATHLVSLASLASQVLARFLAIKVSATPAMAPDRPALFPDWSSTTAIRKIAAATSTMLRINWGIFTLHRPFGPGWGIIRPYAMVYGRSYPAPLSNVDSIVAHFPADFKHFFAFLSRPARSGGCPSRWPGNSRRR